MRPSPQKSIRWHVLVGLSLAGVLISTVAGWAAVAQLASAVIAPGYLVVESDVKKVQHPTGGVVGELLVHEGEHVVAGQVVVRLDETLTRANLAIVANALDELLARQSRLDAEAEGHESISIPEPLRARQSVPDVSRLIAAERRLFELRAAARDGQKSQFRERIAQFKNQIDGLEEQSAAKTREIELIEKELEGVEELWKKNLVPLTRINSLRREKARLWGERGQLIASTAQTKGRIAEVELQIIQVDQDLRREVAEELGQVRTKIGELRERKIAAEDQLKRVELRAPRSGMVHELAVHTVGGVIDAGQAVMLIVPDDVLTVEAKVRPNDIDQLHLGQAATLRFSAFNVRTTPEIHGTVSRISPDLTTDQKTGVSYYTMRVRIDKAELARLGSRKLIAGMPVEVFVQTGMRSVLSYLLKPLTDSLARSFREG